MVIEIQIERENKTKLLRRQGKIGSIKLLGLAGALAFENRLRRTQKKGKAPQPRRLPRKLDGPNVLFRSDS
jgi:hypothetical protein